LLKKNHRDEDGRDRQVAEVEPLSCARSLHEPTFQKKRAGRVDQGGGESEEEMGGHVRRAAVPRGLQSRGMFRSVKRLGRMFFACY